jgi:hypothetical protein
MCRAVQAVISRGGDRRPRRPNRTPGRTNNPVSICVLSEKMLKYVKQKRKARRRAGLQCRTFAAGSPAAIWGVGMIADSIGPLFAPEFLVILSKVPPSSIYCPQPSDLRGARSVIYQSRAECSGQMLRQTQSPVRSISVSSASVLSCRSDA